MNRVEIINKIESAKISDNLLDIKWIIGHPDAIVSKDFAWYPLYLKESLEYRLCKIMVAQLKFKEPLSSAPSSHTVVLAYWKEDINDDSFSFWCGDAFLETIDKDFSARINNSIEDFRSRNISFSESDIKAILSECSNLQGVSAPKSSPCNFRQTWAINKTACNHVDSFLAHISDDTTWALASSYLLKPKVFSLTGYSPSLDYLAFKIPVILEGDRGSGKTTLARKFGAQFNTIEFGGHESIEAGDFIGHYVLGPNKSFIWKDGPLSRAFRSAASGIKTVLIIDEILRIPTRQLSSLLTALSPFEGFLSLSTDRIVSVSEGLATVETLTVKVENLAIIATTNIGGSYAVDSYDPAFSERFFIIRYDNDTNKIAAIIIDELNIKGFSLMIANKIISFYQAMLKFKSSGLIKEVPTSRTLSLVIRLANSEEDIPKGLSSMHLQWVARSSEGIPVKEQINLIDTSIARIFK